LSRQSTARLIAGTVGFTDHNSLGVQTAEVTSGGTAGFQWHGQAV